ncbi:hypothetical protein [Nonomuraea jabiensis]|uniref:hypothetical protein n=1 Tax=Nonomuraea jabiensis TaxID=882448 RepID=UPI003D7401F1
MPRTTRSGAAHCARSATAFRPNRNDPVSHDAIDIRWQEIDIRTQGWPVMRTMNPHSARTSSMPDSSSEEQQ